MWAGAFLHNVVLNLLTCTCKYSFDWLLLEIEKWQGLPHGSHGMKFGLKRMWTSFNKQLCLVCLLASPSQFSFLNASTILISVDKNTNLDFLYLKLSLFSSSYLYSYLACCSFWWAKYLALMIGEILYTSHIPKRRELNILFSIEENRLSWTQAPYRGDVMLFLFMSCLLLFIVRMIIIYVLMHHCTTCG